MVTDPTDLGHPDLSLYESLTKESRVFKSVTQSPPAIAPIVQVNQILSANFHFSPPITRI